jgi:hypothetical protein
MKNGNRNSKLDLRYMPLSANPVEVAGNKRHPEYELNIISRDEGTSMTSARVKTPAHNAKRLQESPYERLVT